MSGRRALLALSVSLGACGPALQSAPHLEAPMNAEATAGVRHEPVARLLSDHWEWTLARWPEWATRVGDHRYDDRVSDRSAEAAEAELRQLEVFLERARAIDQAALDEPDRTTLALFREEVEASVAASRCHMERWSVGVRDNPLIWMNELAEAQPLRTPEEADRLVLRYEALPASVDQAIATLRLGAAQGMFANAESVRRTLAMIEAALAEPVERWPVVVRAAEHRPEWPPEAIDQFAARVRQVAELQLRPALVRFRDLLRDEILPRARPEEQAGLGALPGGDACYAALIRRHTSLDLTPDELHAFGLAELERIHAEMRALGQSLFGQGDLAVLFHRLRTDPDLYFRSAAEVEARATAALLMAEAAMPKILGRPPAARCEIRLIPDYEAPFTTIAYYMPAVPDEAPGYYYVNAWAPETRPRYEAAVLAYHESVPGHHLQIALAQELGDLPAFRRHLGSTAFVEGWALYVERLADELNLYPKDLDRMGMLSFDSWRAGRLVVDTGIHAKGWTRAEAEAFLKANTPLAENNIANEVDRYISWPGQALAYKVGQREIFRLRAEARQALGDRFSLTGFHEAVLSGGAVTMPVLAERVSTWVAQVSRERGTD